MQASRPTQSNPAQRNLARRMFSLVLRAGSVLGMIGCLAAHSAEPDLGSLESSYPTQIRPLLNEYCSECHAESRTEADIDLAAFATWADVRKQPQTWQKIGEMLGSGQMPPPDARQPSNDERAHLNQWVQAYLKVEARASAGDPGRVILRRLNNAEYTYTLRDLTQIGSLDPAREFPVDGAAGEGFTNSGAALVMSPALLAKYLDAAKQVAAHAVLLPDGFRFSPHTTRRDWTNDVLARIHEFYGRHTDSRGATQVNLQGIVFETNGGGRLPVEPYLAAILDERASLAAGTKTLATVARERGLSPKYIQLLMTALEGNSTSPVLAGLRTHWQSATPASLPAILTEIAGWQQALWKFSSVGHIGKVGGPRAWQEPVKPWTARHEVRFKIPPAPSNPAASAPAITDQITLYLTASDAGDGDDHDILVWDQPRLVTPGRPDLLLRDLQEIARQRIALREELFVNVAKYLAAVAEASSAQTHVDIEALASKHGVNVLPLSTWLEYLGIGTGGSVKIESHLTNQLTSSAGYDFVRGWGTAETPLLTANSSDQHVRIPGNMKPHGVAVHPAPALQTAVGWQSPIGGLMELMAVIQHAHPECGNGVTWSIELRRGATRRRLAAGIAHGAKEVKVGPLEKFAVQPGDLVTLMIGPRDGNHSCDLTAIDLTLTSDAGTAWDLAADVSPDVLAGNPHADRNGNAGVWHFYTEPASGGETGAAVPAGSVLAKWQSASSPDEQQKLADALQTLLVSGPPTDKDSPDATLYRQLVSLGGPLLSAARIVPSSLPDGDATSDPSDWGLDPRQFGQYPSSSGADTQAAPAVDSASLCVRAPTTIAIRLPADLVSGCELVTSAVLHPQTGSEGSVQVQVGTEPPSGPSALRPGLPILVNPGTDAEQRFATALDEFRQLFPAALCYSRIVPVDEAVTLTLYYREDDHLRRLILDDSQTVELERLWDELHYVSQDAVTLVDAFEQLMEFATQDADPTVFAPLRKPIHDRADAFRQRLVDTAPRHVDALLDFASRAYRRPLTPAERQELDGLYSKLRGQDLPHDEAWRLTLARILVAPAFLYRLEKAPPGESPGRVSDWELASRLSFFLWSSGPDDELRALAASNRLHEPETLAAQARRMLRDDRARRLATEFACQWLHIYEFDALDEKSERHFPTFGGLRSAMYEESIRFFTDLFQNDGSLLTILDADHTFLNEDLARHYAIPNVTGPEWRRVDGIREFARGGILTQATVLAKQSGASRTSPILRGNWISEVLLGERLPRPPKNVPQLPDTVPPGLTERELVERHTSDPACAKCHARIDPFGFALEAFDAIGRNRDADPSKFPTYTRTTLYDGSEIVGVDGLRRYLVDERRADILRQFCRKLLGYALGRSVQLSDEPLLEELQQRLRDNGYRFSTALDAVVLSNQFGTIRGQQHRE